MLPVTLAHEKNFRRLRKEPAPSYVGASGQVVGSEFLSFGTASDADMDNTHRKIEDALEELSAMIFSETPDEDMPEELKVQKAYYGKDTFQKDMTPILRKGLIFDFTF